VSVRGCLQPSFAFFDELLQGERVRIQDPHVSATLFDVAPLLHHQTSLRAGTVFDNTKLPLTQWFLAIYLLTQSKTNMAALELARHLGVCYRSAWRMKHKLMEVMRERETSRRLDGFVEIDDAYLGGECNGGKRGRGSQT